jgi:hypothetical protein
MQISILFSAHVGVGNDQDFCCGWNFEKAQGMISRRPLSGCDGRHILVDLSALDPVRAVSIQPILHHCLAKLLSCANGGG